MITSEDNWMLEKRRQDQEADACKSRHRFRQLIVVASTISLCCSVASIARCRSESVRVRYEGNIETERLKSQAASDTNAKFVACLQISQSSVCHSIVPSERQQLELEKVAGEEQMERRRLELANEWLVHCMHADDIPDSDCPQLVIETIAGES